MLLELVQQTFHQVSSFQYLVSENIVVYIVISENSLSYLCNGVARATYFDINSI